MNKQQFEDKVRLIISEQCGVELCDVEMFSHLEDDFNVDSLTSVEIVMNLEEEFDIEITEDEAWECGHKVSDICRHLAEKLDYTFYKEDVPQKAPVSIVECFCGSSSAEHTYTTECSSETTTGALEEDNIINENEFAFTKIQSIAKENNLLLSFEASGKVVVYSGDDEFVIENYEQLKQVTDALKVLDSYRG